MNDGERRSIILPVLLIVVGLALLLEQFGVWHPDWGEILRLWPVLLVLLGLELIARGRRAGGWVTALLVVGVLLVVALGALLVLAALRAVRHSANGWDWPVLFLAGFLVLAALEVPLVMTDRLRQYPYVLVPLLVVLLAQPAAARSSSSSAAE